MINCTKCGMETISETIAGKQTKNCKPCRAMHSNNSKRPQILKCEKMPEQGFYKQEQINIINDEPKDEQEEQQEEQQQDEQDEDTPPEQEKTIRELLTDIFNKFDELEIASKEQTKKQNELTDIVFSILNKLVANENKFNDFVLQSNLKNNNNTNSDNTTNDSTNNIFNDIIKQQDLKNKIVINKLDKIINAIT